MATTSQTFRALIEADAKGAVKDLQKFNGEVEKATVGGAKKTDQLGAAFSRMGKVVAGLGVARVLQQSVMAASDLEESVNAVNVTFGSAAAGVLKLSENAARGVGLASSEFNGLAVQFSSFADRVAGDGGDVVGVIDDITKRAADFASVMNLDVNEAARIFQSALAGETEPIKKFGIDMSAAAVEAYALANGLAESKAEITESIKVQARYGLLMQSTAKTQGDFANTSDSLANQLRIAKAEITNASAALGAELLPVAADAAGTVADFVGVLGKMPDAGKSFALGAAAVVAGLGTIGARATGIVALLSQVAVEANAIDAGLGGEQSRRDYLNKDVAFYEKPLQGIAKFSYALGAGQWGTWRDEAGEALEAASMAAARFDATLLEGVTTVDGAQAAIREWADGLGLSEDAALHAANIVTAQYLPAIRDGADATSAAAQQDLIAAEMKRDYAKSADYTATVLGRVEARQQAAAEATERHRQAVEDLFDEIEKNLSTTFDYEESLIATENAVQDFADAAVSALEAANDSEASAADRERALRDMRSAEIDAAYAALDAASAYAASTGAMEGTTAFAIAQREELNRLAAQFPELNDEIAQFVAELNRIPAVKTVTLTINRAGTNAALAGNGATVRVDEFGNLKTGVGATGGIVTRPTLSIIGEAGPEAVVPLNRMPGASPLPGGMGGGVTIGQVVVQAPAGANADEFGRMVWQAIERESRWRGPVSGIAA